MKTILASFVAIVALAWGVEMLSPGHTAAGSLPWAIYLESLFLTGLFSIALMSLAMVLSTRPVWLEQTLGGMDRIYRLHKWSGILAVVFAASHWLLEMSDDLFKALAGYGGRVKEDELSAFAEPLRDMGEALGDPVEAVLLPPVAAIAPGDAGALSAAGFPFGGARPGRLLESARRAAARRTVHRRQHRQCALFDRSHRPQASGKRLCGRSAQSEPRYHRGELSP